MDIVKVALIGVFTILLMMMLKSCKSEWAGLIAIASGILLALYLLDFLLELSQVLNMWEQYFSSLSEYMGILWKALGITYVCEFSSNVCKDNGSQLLASQIELCGKVAVMLLGMPILWALLETVTGYSIG